MILLELISVMENSVFSVPVDMFDRNSVAMEGMEPQVTSSSLVLLDSFNQNQTLGGYTMLSTLPGETINYFHSGVHAANRSMVLDSDELAATMGRHVRKDPSLDTSSTIVNNEFHEQFVGGTPISYAPLATLLAARSDLQENPENFVISGSSICHLEPVSNFVSSDCSNAQNFSFASSINSESPEIYGNMNGRVVFDRFPDSEELVGRNPVRVELQSSMENLEPHCWISLQGVSVGSSNPYGSSRFNNELSLSLATAQPSVVNGTNISDQSSVISCGLTKNCVGASKLGSDQTSSSSKELSLSCASNRAGQFSQVISASRYLHVIQEILAQIASYSIENLDQRTLYSTGSKTAGNMQFFDKRMLPVSCQESPNVNGKFEVQMDPSLQKRALEAKKTQLLTLLQMVDDQYNQCLDEIHTVISAFHAATELDPQMHARFALRTISFLYKSLRERISNKILSIGAQFDSDSTTGTEESFETSFLQKQWTLQQLKKKDQQIWRPQRGLPERSVSVLRAWMFQNFLHPYPKDSEKHLLAVKSGLTRSQVSNWFINARVRLWKPMIEEMYAEMNKRNARQIEDGTSSNHRSQIGNISNIRRFNVN